MLPNGVLFCSIFIYLGFGFQVSWGLDFVTMLCSHHLEKWPLFRPYWLLFSCFVLNERLVSAHNTDWWFVQKVETCVNLKIPGRHARGLHSFSKRSLHTQAKVSTLWYVI